MAPGEHDALVSRLKEMFPPGVVVSDCTVVETRASADTLVVLLRCEQDSRLYGVPIALNDTTHDYYYTDFEVSSTEEWLDSVGLGLMISLDTGLRLSARRTQFDDYIEVRPEGGWPYDRRFYSAGLVPGDVHRWARVPFVAESGLDPSPAVAARDAGRLLVWVAAYENNRTGSPYVGQAVVVWDDDAPSVARLTHLEVTEGVPVMVLVDLAHHAAHVAGSAGARTVTAKSEIPELALVGFRGPDGLRSLDTSFLAADPDGASRLLAESLAAGGRWGENRDSVGRYLPRSRLGRWAHRLRHWRRECRRKQRVSYYVS